MKKLITLSLLSCVLASSALASTVVASPPLVDLTGWTKKMDMQSCYKTGLRAHSESFLQKDGSLVPNYRLYERRVENNVLVIVRDAEFKDGVFIRDDRYIYNEKWVKFDLINGEFGEYMDALRAHPNVKGWTSGETICPSSR